MAMNTTFFPNTMAVYRGATEDIKANAEKGKLRSALWDTAKGVAALPVGIAADVANTGLALSQEVYRPLRALVTDDPGPYWDYGGLGFGGNAYDHGGQVTYSPDKPPAVEPPTAPPTTPAVPVPAKEKPYEMARIATGSGGPGEPRFTRRVRPESPLKGVTMPMLSGNVNLGDLMSYRLGLLSTGGQLVPKVAKAAQRDKMFDKAKDEATLGLKQLELGQDREIARAKALSSELDRQTTLQAARIKADKGGMANAMKEIEAQEQFASMLPVGAADLEGRTPAAFATQLADVYNPTNILRATRMLQDRAAQTGSVDLDSPEVASKFNADLAKLLNIMEPGKVKMPEEPQQ